MYTFKSGATSKTIEVFIQDSSKTDGSGLTGLVYNSVSLVASYVRPGAARSAITLATQTVTGAWSSGGFVEIDATNMPGWYRLDVPDAAIAASVDHVGIMLKGATNMAPCNVVILLTAADFQDSVRLGLTALPNAAAEASGGLYTRGTGAGQINQDANGRIDANAKAYADTTISVPATAGIPDVNVKNMNNVAATSITTINANQGTTQPVNFTGTGGSALVKGDAVDIGGTAQTGADVGALTTEINADTDELITTIGVAGAGLTAIPDSATLIEMNGLLGKNSGLRSTSYSGSNLISYDLCLYDNSTDAAINDGVTGLLHKYHVANTYDGSGNILTSVTTRVS